MAVRIVTGVVGILLATVVIQLGGVVFNIAALLLSLMIWLEYTQAFVRKKINLPILAGIIALVAIWFYASKNSIEGLLAVSLVVMLGFLASTVLCREKIDFIEAGISIMGIFYFGWAFACMNMLRSFSVAIPLDGFAAFVYVNVFNLFNPETVIHTSLAQYDMGVVFIWLMFLGTWSNDIFGYFIGCNFGKHKLCPRISPSKTWEGFLGSVVGTFILIMFVGGCLFGLDTIYMAVLGILLPFFATMGDLVESVVKRYAGIKDSGRLIPGHGGVWDRFDSILFTAPLVYYFAQMMNHMGVLP